MFLKMKKKKGKLLDVYYVNCFLSQFNSSHGNSYRNCGFNQNNQQLWLSSIIMA